MKDKNLRKNEISLRKFKALAIFIALLMISTPILAVVKAQGPHIETPRSVIINEIHSGSSAWIELVNPTSEDINIHDWQIQIGEDLRWNTIYSVESEFIEKWGGGKEHIVFNLEVALPNEELGVRIIDNQGNEIDKTIYSSLDDEHTWARYKQETGIPVDTDSVNDWYISSKITKGYENDSVMGSV